MDYIIGIDIGTTCTKAIAYGVNNEILKTSSKSYSINSPLPTWCEQNPEEIFGAVLYTIKNVKLEEGKNLLLGIVFSSAMHSLIAIDETGKPITECIIWADTRSKQYAETLKESLIGKEIYKQTGTPIHPMMPLTKIVWLRNNAAKVYENVYKFIGIKEYVIFKLTGEYVIDYSVASATGLFNIHEFKWNKESLTYAGITEEKLSLPVPSEHILKNISNKYSHMLGIDEKLGIVVGASDGCLANLGANVLKEGTASITIGTSGAIRVTTRKPAIDEKGQLFSYILSEGYYVSGGAVNNGGVILNWFKDKFINKLVRENPDSKKASYDELISGAEKIAPGAEGLIFLPYLLGERAPLWDPDARGVFFGININHDAQHFVRAVLEGITFGIYNIGKILEQSSGNFDTIFAGGGFSASEFWLQMLADIFNKKVIITNSKEGSAVGGAILGFKALGIINSLSEGAGEIKDYKSFHPNLSNHQIYMKNYNIYEKLYSKLMKEFKEICELQQNI